MFAFGSDTMEWFRISWNPILESNILQASVYRETWPLRYIFFPVEVNYNTQNGFWNKHLVVVNILSIVNGRYKLMEIISNENNKIKKNKYVQS